MYISKKQLKEIDKRIEDEAWANKKKEYGSMFHGEQHYKLSSFKKNLLPVLIMCGFTLWLISIMWGYMQEADNRVVEVRHIKQETQIWN